MAVNFEAGQPSHPYYPLGIEIAGYIANDKHFTTLLNMFAAGSASLLGLTIVIARKWRPNLNLGELNTVLWFILSGSIHAFFEGYYVLHFHTLASRQSFFAQLWKEYAHSDSRYLTQDPQLLILEAITVLVWAPSCFCTAFFILTRSSARYPLQMLVSLGHLYSAVLYYSTALAREYMLGLSYSRPETVYFWFYFIGANALWVVLPAYLLTTGFVRCTQALAVVQSIDEHGYGVVKPTPPASLKSD